uniref:Uncharacterized protein n=1 Tax=Amphilophus citrinellus TaxID=61819 RepID=A0A3Q0SZ62_AMPCI
MENMITAYMIAIIAYTPSPCRGSGHLGMQKRAVEGQDSNH